jgi:hypothetical protein
LNESRFSAKLLAESGFYANIQVGHIKSLRSASVFPLRISGVVLYCRLQILWLGAGLRVPEEASL